MFLLKVLIIVMIVEPGELRGRMAGEARRLARMYGWEVRRDDGEKAATGDHQFFGDFFGG